MELNFAIGSSFARLRVVVEFYEVCECLMTSSSTLYYVYINDTLDNFYTEMPYSPITTLLLYFYVFEDSCHELDSWIYCSCFTVVCWLLRSWMTSERGMLRVENGSSWCRKVVVWVGVIPIFMVINNF